MPEALKFKFITPLYDYFPIQLKILSELRKETAYSEENGVAINLLTILSCTAFIEGILFENFENVIASERTNQVSEVINNILTKIKNSLSGASFNDYNKISKEVLGQGLNHFTTNSTWEAMKIMFALRNKIVHGDILSIEYIRPKGGEYIRNEDNNYEAVIKFMIKEKLLEKGNVNISSIVSNKVIVFFTEATKDFFRDITTKLANKFKEPKWDNFLHLRELLRQMELI